MGDNSFLIAYEDELSKLAIAAVGGKTETIAGAAAALFVKVTSGSSILAAAAEKAAAKAFGRWFVDNPDRRFREMAARFEALEKKERERETFAAWLQSVITRAVESAENQKEQNLSEQGYYDLFGRVLRGITELKEDHSELKDSTRRIETGIGTIIDKFAEQGLQAPHRKTRLYGRYRHRSTVFVGRDTEIAQLEALLSKKSHVRLAASIEGLAGIGKTELALQFASKMQLENKFPGGIFWIDASNPNLTAVLGSEIADACLREYPPRTGFGAGKMVSNQAQPREREATHHSR